MSTKDTWRITSEKEFLDIALDYITPLINKIRTEWEDGKYCKEKTKRISNAFRDITPAVATNSTIKGKKTLLKYLVNVCVEDVDDWSNFSLDPESSLDDIMLRTMITEYTGKSFLCYLYITKNPKVTKEFIKDINYVTSGYFSFNIWDDNLIDAIDNCIENEIYPIDCPELVKIYGENKLKDAKIITSKINPKPASYGSKAVTEQ